MRATILALTALVTLAACGADGPPIPPAAKAAAQPGLAVSGEVGVGVTLQ